MEIGVTRSMRALGVDMVLKMLTGKLTLFINRIPTSRLFTVFDWFGNITGIFEIEWLCVYVTWTFCLLKVDFLTFVNIRQGSIM